MPKISVIIPAYNVEPYLSDLLDDVLQQTMQDFEVIIVNDGSIDGTKKVIEAYVTAYPERFFSFSEKNSGQSAARNLALNYAKGEYIAFLDADDRITKDYFETLYFAASLEDADISKCSIADFDSDTEHSWKACDIVARTITFEPGYTFSFHNSPCAGLIRRSFLNQYSIRFSVGEQMEDSPFGILVNLLSNRTAIVDKYLYFHRVRHSGSTMTKVAEGKRNPNVPYCGMEDCAKILFQFLHDPVRQSVAEYFVMNTLACFITSMYKNYGSDLRKRLCQYCYGYMAEYYPNASKNPYLFGNKAANISALPFLQRAAVRAFVVAWKLHILYPFSTMASRILRHVNV